MLDFEFDETKSRFKSKKHGIDFRQAQKHINVDFPSWVVECLDKEAARIGVTRQSIIKVWLIERIKAEAANHLPNTDTASGAH